MKSILSVLAVLAVAPCLAQDPFPRIDSISLPGAGITSSRTFKGQALFGYMDGGAELYLEYGFTAAEITRLNLSGGDYKIEIFKMKGPEESFGIFSVSRFNCRSTPDLSEYSCLTKYQLQLCCGQYYISIIGRKGNQTDSLNMLKIGNIIVSKINETSMDLSCYLPGTSMDGRQLNCFLAKGRLGIVNGSPDLEDFFSGMEGYTAVILKQETKRIISIKFDSEEMQNSFLNLHKWDSKLLTGDPEIMPGGEQVKKLAGNHLYIVTSSN